VFGAAAQRRDVRPGANAMTSQMACVTEAIPANSVTRRKKCRRARTATSTATYKKIVGPSTRRRRARREIARHVLARNEQCHLSKEMD
jgi:hypothetical protein